MGQALGLALKYTRRMTYLHADAWRVLVISKTPAMQKLAYDEILRTLDAGSLKVESKEYDLTPTPYIQLERGATIKFHAVRTLDQAYYLSGRQYTHIMYMYEPDDWRIRDYLKGLLRSPRVPDENLVEETIDW